MKFCLPGKKLGRLKQKKNFLRVEARPKKRPVITVLFNVLPVGILKKHKLQSIKMS